MFCSPSPPWLDDGAVAQNAYGDDVGVDGCAVSEGDGDVEGAERCGGLIAAGTTG